MNINRQVAWMAVFVAALGYFVDVFDMWLFSNLRVSSLKSIGVRDEDLTSIGASLINYQQAGFLVGGILWGILGDKRGRLSVMFGSIFLYSVATFANAYVYDLDVYRFLRFVSGFGLAGEIGAGITLVSELLPKDIRGIGTTIVASVGVAGCIAASLAGKYFSEGHDWRIAFEIGGITGFALLLLRIITHESGMFKELLTSDAPRGSLRLLFASGDRIKRLVCCVFVGAPIYVLFGIVITFSKEISTAMNIPVVNTPDVFLYASVALTLGDIFAGGLSQIIKSRKKTLIGLISISFLLGSYFSLFGVNSKESYIYFATILSFLCGFWAVLITTTAELFGTNLRATVTTSVPNLIRGLAIPMNLLFVYLFKTLGFTAAQSAGAVIILFFAGALIAVFNLPETYGKDLDYLER